MSSLGIIIGVLAIVAMLTLGDGLYYGHQRPVRQPGAGHHGGPAHEPGRHGGRPGPERGGPSAGEAHRPGRQPHPGHGRGERGLPRDHRRRAGQLQGREPDRDRERRRPPLRGQPQGEGRQGPVPVRLRRQRGGAGQQNSQRHLQPRDKHGLLHQAHKPLHRQITGLRGRRHHAGAQRLHPGRRPQHGDIHD